MFWVTRNSILKLFFGSIVITYCYGFFQGFNHVRNNSIIDHARLAKEYFKADANWYLKNIPFFECSDKKIQDVYYYRWKLYKAHIRNVGEKQYVITEFLDDVSWDKDPYSSLNDATGFHIYEGRWLKDRKYLDGYINYMYRGGGNDRHFSEGIAYATYAYYLVNDDSSFIKSQLSIMEHIYNLWLDHYDLKKDLYYIEPLLDATEYTISSIDASGGKDGFRGGDAFRPTINSYMYGNALAIARIAKMKDDTTLSRIYLKRAKQIKMNLQSDLWDDSLHHFIDRYEVSNQYVHYWDFIRGRELAGYVPWYYNLPDNSAKYNSAWANLMDTTKFLGRYGLRTDEPSYQYYMRQYRYAGAHPECQWNGPSWPFQETQVLEAMANLLNNYSQKIISSSDYLKILLLYTQQHYLPDGKLNLQEDYNPDTGKPIVGLYRSSHYNHSSYNDLIITGLCGIRPSEGNTLIINPLIDSTIKYFCLDDVLYHGHNLSVIYDSDGKKYNLGKGLSVYVDGEKASLKKVAGKYEVNIGHPIITKPKYKVDLALNIWRNDFPKPSASINSEPDSLYKAIDGRIWYFSEITNRWSTYGSLSPSDWYEIDFKKAKNVSSAKLYFYEDDKTYKKPSNYNIEFWEGNQWQSIKEKSRIPNLPVGNTVNTVTFDKVVTAKIKFIFKNNSKKYAIAVTEIQLY
jgi:Mannosylglycerate hydrolase MGH1-like glycoside hydrolase domain/NedA-like, galactose-binding domain/Glycosyl hydrolase family 65, C-terminal domain